MIDLKSDTVTRPTPTMLAFMAQASSGDDAYGLDTTTHELESYCAALFGKEAALFTVSGTMSNQLALHMHTTPGDDVMLDTYHHINYFESAQSSAFARVALHPVATKNGILTGADIDHALYHKAQGAPYAKTSLVCLENTISYYGGLVYPYDELTSLALHLKQKQLALHMDGARLAHAVVKTGISFRDYAQCADSVSLCFSKALGAPFGSILVGTRDAINKARKVRKWLGGQLHQSGYMAGAALYALKNNVGRLREDHDNALLFAQLLVGIDGIKVDPNNVATNIVMFDVAALKLTTQDCAERLEHAGLSLFPWDPTRLRAVFHNGVTRDDVVRAVEIIAKFCEDTLASEDIFLLPAPAPYAVAQPCKAL